MINRIKIIKDNLDDNQALLITNGPSRLYFTGFQSSAGVLLITKSSSVFFIDFRYFEKAKKSIDHIKVVLLSNTLKQINEILEKEKVTEVFFETAYTTFSVYENFEKGLVSKLSTSNKFDKIISDMRSCKCAYELECIKTAQRFTDKTFEYILGQIEVGKTEREIMLDMEFYMRKLGSEGVAFDFIVVSGKNSSLPHGKPTDKKIESGDFITMDFGAKFKGYCSDMTRTVAVGTVSEEQRKVYETVLFAQSEAMKNIKPGAVCKEIDAIARNIIYNSYEGCFGHGLGHSIGIEVHENPNFNTKCETILKPGMILSVEPGIYIENQFGVRIEDLVYITENGYENLTASTKELIII